MTGLFLLGSALVGAGLVGVLAWRDGRADPILVTVVGLAVVATGLLVVGDWLWYRRARRAEVPVSASRSGT